MRILWSNRFSCSNPVALRVVALHEILFTYDRIPSHIRTVIMLRLANEAAVKPGQRSAIARITLPSPSVVEHRVHRQTLNLGEFVPCRCCCVAACCGLQMYILLRSSLLARNASGNACPGSPAPPCALFTRRCMLTLSWQPLHPIFSDVGCVYLLAVQDNMSTATRTRPACLLHHHGRHVHACHFR